MPLSRSLSASRVILAAGRAPGRGSFAAGCDLFEPHRHDVADSTPPWRFLLGDLGRVVIAGALLHPPPPLGLHVLEARLDGGEGCPVIPRPQLIDASIEPFLQVLAD